MATAHGITTHLPTGPVAASAPITADEVQEYERILRISDEIFAGSHPRLKVPQQFVRKPDTRYGQNGLSTLQVAKDKPRGHLADSASWMDITQSPNSLQAPPPIGNAPPTTSANTAPSSTRTPLKTTSEIDPIFLVKSDDLVRAEIQLQRQRVERALRDQLEQRKQELKQKPAIQDTKPDFNVSEVLDRALEIVRPVSLSDPSEVNGPSDSFDDNSFYSSRAPDSPQPAGGNQKSSPPSQVQTVDPGVRVPVDHYADELQRLEALNRPGSDQEMREAYPVVYDQHALYSQNQQPPPIPMNTAHQSHEAQQADVLEEPEYSPPAPVAPPIDLREYERDVAIGDRRGGYIDRTQVVPQTISPANNMKVVQNSITSPAAPRPSRVSPLATAKLPSVQQPRDRRFDQAPGQVFSDPDSTRGSPNAPVPHLTSRKRRKLHETGDQIHSSSNKGQNADLPETYIKEEPVSPPPFADDPAVIRDRQPQERPVFIDIASPQYAIPLERHEHSRQQRPTYEVGHYSMVPVDQTPVRTVSRSAIRRPVRDDGDLRRVASMQYARQSEYPREYIETDPRGTRAASYAVMERPLQERPRYYEEAPSYGPRYIAVDDAPQPVYRESYYEDFPPARVAPASTRRFVVDEHGNHFEMVPAPRMPPMAPPPRPISRAQHKPELYDDRAPIRTASVRAPSVVQDPYGERRYVQEMPPPQPVYRRVASDYARPVTGERTYAAPLEGHDPYARSGSVQVAEYVPRHPAYVEERAYAPERVIRTASVRPAPARYEEPPEVVQRVGSVHPGGPSREVSVYLDDRQMGDYIERPYYVRERRYYEGDEGNRMALEGPGESAPRAPQQHY
ncbi:hypothetical protein N7462_007448 [Penicillium macrosclerotiorum]|uniref:uncharacterized protein n=1 Tax=Penicillium macrosclerotiorum TaxID=303699 RepID=UPI002548763B|nr:uncharacterized protein N7462_007448 [Penicillium macrosclerotiorum]KAJ5679204.1 hypothetical protein N7462_007448 [Penicillium macrosclerotiorum]